MSFALSGLVQAVVSKSEMSRLFRSIASAYQSDVAPDGTFRIEKVLPGKFIVRVQPNEPDWYVKAPGGVVDLDEPAPPVRLQVTVAEDGASLSGTIEDKTGPVTHGYASVQLLPEGFNPQDRIYATPAQGGRYSLRGLPPGAYRLLAIDPSAGWTEDLWKKAERIELKAGEKVTKAVKVTDAQ